MEDLSNFEFALYFFGSIFIAGSLASGVFFTIMKWISEKNKNDYYE